MTTVIEEPGQRALHLPAVLHNLEPLARVLDRVVPVSTRDM